MGCEQDIHHLGVTSPSLGPSLVSLRRVTIDEGHNRVHYTFGSNAYDRSYSRDEGSDMMSAMATNACMLGL